MAEVITNFTGAANDTLDAAAPGTDPETGAPIYTCSIAVSGTPQKAVSDKAIGTITIAIAPAAQ